MKNALVLIATLIGIFTLYQVAFAVSGVFLSSNTITADSNVKLCSTRAFVHGVCVSSSTANTAVTLYNSSYTATGVTSIGGIDSSAKGCYFYDTIFNSGLLYNKTGTAAITILYTCY